MIRIQSCIGLLVLGMLILAPAGFSQNIEIDASSPFVYPEFSKKISMDFKDAALDNILKIFSQQTGLNFITSEAVANRQVTVYLDNVPVEQALEQLLRANNLTYEVQPGSNIYLVKQLPPPETELLTRVYTLKHASVTSAQIEKTIKITDVEKSGEGGITETLKNLLSSKGRIIEDPRTNSLIISDIASNFLPIENALAKLDVPVPQILIEVEMLEVTKETADQLGTQVSDNALLSVKGASKKVFFPFPDQALGDRYANGIVDFTGMQAAVKFLRTQTGTKTLARPRIMTLNNQAAEIKIVTKEAVGNISSVSGSASNISTSTTSAERVDTGVSLIVTPQANLLTGEITIAIYPKVAVVKNETKIGDTTFFNPETRETKTLLRVQAGDTIIIGGLLRKDESKQTTKIPLLGDIPFLGSLFRYQDNSVTDRELIVFITPHIINETPVPQTTVANIRRLNREQDVPGSDPLARDSGMNTKR